jgi:hypothetical protein
MFVNFTADRPFVLFFVKTKGQHVWEASKLVDLGDDEDAASYFHPAATLTYEDSCVAVDFLRAFPYDKCEVSGGDK